ncbi:MAG TPA: metallopeptidase family protein [Thermomicrobiales bacterium]|nr:metallopeptidase family protein [Thermomicrobiales bacterium]
MVSSLPIDTQQYLDNVAIVVADEPSSEQLQESDLGDGDEMFGLYTGVPRSERGSGYSMVLPDQITIFMGPLERAFTRRGDLEEQIRITVLHELGHHLGFDEDGLDTLGLA